MLLLLLHAVAFAGCHPSVYQLAAASGAWTLQHTLTATSGGAGDKFACALSVDDDKLAVAAEGQGQVYVYQKGASG